MDSARPVERSIPQSGGDVGDHQADGQDMWATGELGPERVASDPREGYRARILVIDDEPAMLRSLRRALAREHDVTDMSSAAEALNLIRQGERYDVILCDLHMPEMSGMDFDAGLSITAPDQLDRLFFLTGGAVDERSHDFLLCRTSREIHKPFELETLRRLIWRVIDRRPSVL